MSRAPAVSVRAGKTHLAGSATSSVSDQPSRLTSVAPGLWSSIHGERSQFSSRTPSVSLPAMTEVPALAARNSVICTVPGVPTVMLHPVPAKGFPAMSAMPCPPAHPKFTAPAAGAGNVN